MENIGKWRENRFLFMKFRWFRDEEHGWQMCINIDAVSTYEPDVYSMLIGVVCVRQCFWAGLINMNQPQQVAPLQWFSAGISYVFICFHISCHMFSQFSEPPADAEKRFRRNGQEAVPHADEAADDQGGTGCGVQLISQTWPPVEDRCIFIYIYIDVHIYI